MIFDIDGTLIDTNLAHVEAWVRAFARLGYKIPADRIEVEIGKGGDKLVSSVVGQSGEECDGESLRRVQQDEFLAIAAQQRFPVFPRVPELFRALRERGIRTALATSSNQRHLRGTLESAGIDLPALADEMVTKDDAEASKPAPDLVLAAAEALGLSPAQCALVGDTPYDAESAHGAGVVCLGVLSGGFGNEELRGAGAREVWRDTGHLLEDLPHALDVASPGKARLDRPRLEQLMREALAVAREGLEHGEVPIGAVLARSDGTILARGYNELQHTGDRTAHAEMSAFRRVAGRIEPGSRDLVLVSTLEPCVMCTGAAMEAAVDTVVFGLEAPADSGTHRVSPPSSPEAIMPRIVGNVLPSESRALLQEWLRTNGNREQREYVEQLLGL